MKIKTFKRGIFVIKIVYFNQSLAKPVTLVFNNTNTLQEVGIKDKYHFVGLFMKVDIDCQTVHQFIYNLFLNYNQST